MKAQKEGSRRCMVLIVRWGGSIYINHAKGWDELTDFRPLLLDCKTYQFSYPKNSLPKICYKGMNVFTSIIFISTV